MSPYGANEFSLKKIIKILKKYERQSKQKVNIKKSLFSIPQNVTGNTIIMVEQCLGMKDYFPMKYLGCPMIHTRKRKEHYAELIEKVKWKLQAWKGKMLSSEVKEVFIPSVWQSTPTYVRFTIVPNIYVTK